MALPIKSKLAEWRQRFGAPSELAALSRAEFEAELARIEARFMPLMMVCALAFGATWVILSVCTVLGAIYIALIVYFEPFAFLRLIGEALHDLLWGASWLAAFLYLRLRRLRLERKLAALSVLDAAPAGD